MITHDLRHFLDQKLLFMGIDIVRVFVQRGHSMVAQTPGTDAHVMHLDHSEATAP